MHRPALPLAAVLVLSLVASLAPQAAAAVTGFQEDAGLEPGTRRAWPLDGAEGDSFTLDWRASGAAVDVFVARGENETAIDNATGSALAFQSLNQSSGRSHVTLSSA